MKIKLTGIKTKALLLMINMSLVYLELAGGGVVT